MNQPLHIELLLNSVAQFNATSTSEDDAYRVEVRKNDKRAVAIWPKQSSEIFFEFIQNGDLILSESIEYYENESPLKQSEEVAQVLEGFMLCQTRVVGVGTLFKRKELQIFLEGTWQPVFQQER